MINQEGIDHAAHFNQLLPLPAVAGKTRHLPGSYSPYPAEAHLTDHPLEAAALSAACSGLTQIIIDNFNLTPTKIVQPLSHGVLKPPAFFVTDDLVRRGLPDVKHCHAR
jgi:hypothetical protein